MRNLPAHPSTVNPKTLVQSKKIGRGKTAAARTRMVFEIEPLRPLCAGLPSRRSQLQARLRSAGCIFSTSGAQEMQKKQSSVSPLRSRLVDQGSSLLKDRRSSLLKFPLVFVRATVCRKPGRPKRAWAPRRSRRCTCFPLPFFRRRLCWRREFFATRRFFSNRRGRRTGLPPRVFDRVSGRLTRAHACRTSGLGSVG